MTGNGTGDGETRAIFAGTTCADQWTVGASDWSCLTIAAGSGTFSAKTDGDANGDGVADAPVTNGGAVVQFSRSVTTDIAGTIEGFPTAAFDWNTFAYYSTYATFHDVSGTVDRIYVRSQTGVAKYSWDTASGETIVGSPRYVTTGNDALRVRGGERGHDGHRKDLPAEGRRGVADGGHLGKLVGEEPVHELQLHDHDAPGRGPDEPLLGRDDGRRPAGLAAGAGAGGVLAVRASDAGVDHADDHQRGAGAADGLGHHLHDAGADGPRFEGRRDEHDVVGGQHVAGVGLCLSAGSGTSTPRVFAGDDSGTMWALDINNFAGTNKASGVTPWRADPIKSSAFYDFTNAVLMFGTDGGKVVALNSSGTALTNYPYTPGATTDSIRSALLYTGGILAVGTTTGKLFFIDRSQGSAAGGLVREYYFGPTESVSGVGFDSSSSRYMVTTSDPTVKDGRLYYIDQIADPTPGAP